MNGKVILVGAGPDAGLLTMRGAEAIRWAEVILYDDLLDKAILSLVSADCQLIPVGKRHGYVWKTQKEIQALLIQKGLEGKRVVRLKGGDSFVFGRGGEEILALQEAGIETEIIPGISSSIAVPEKLGIPVTHRGLADSFTVITGHRGEDKMVDYEPLAKLPGTLVFLMGIHTLSHIAEELIKYGKDPATPASVLSRGYMPGETRIDGTLATIAELARDAATPGIVVIGQVAGLHLAQTDPGTKARVIAIGSAGFNQRLEDTLDDQVELVREDILQIRPQPEKLPENLADYDWISFSSAAGVRGFFQVLRDWGHDLRTLADKKFACVGQGTADVLWEYGFVADLIPEEFNGKALGQALVDRMAQVSAEQAKVLVIQPEHASSGLTTELERGRIVYKRCEIYRTEVVQQGYPVPVETADYLVFSSAGAVSGWLAQQTEPGEVLFKDGTRMICMGQAARDALVEGLPQIDEKLILMPEPMTAAGVCNIVTSYSRSYKTGGSNGLSNEER